MSNSDITVKDNTTPVTITEAVLGLVTATIGLLVAFGANLSQQQQASVLIFAGAVMVAAPMIWNKLAIARSRVVEQADKQGEVTAGPANDLEPDGKVIRNLGAEPPRRTSPEEEGGGESHEDPLPL